MSTSTSALPDSSLAPAGPSVATNPAVSSVNVPTDLKASRTRPAVLRKPQLLRDAAPRILVRAEKSAFRPTLRRPAVASASVPEAGSATRPLDCAGISTNVSNLQPINPLAATGPSVRTCPEATTVPAQTATKAIRSRAATSATASNADAKRLTRSSEEPVCWPTAPEDARPARPEPSASQSPAESAIALAQLVSAPGPTDRAKMSTNVKKESTGSRPAVSAPNVSTGPAVSIANVPATSPEILTKASALPAKCVASPTRSAAPTSAASSRASAFARHLTTRTRKTETNAKARANATLAESTASAPRPTRPNVCASRATPEIRPSAAATSTNAATILAVREPFASTRTAVSSVVVPPDSWETLTRYVFFFRA